MYDIYITDMEIEQCSPHKEKINMVIPYAVFHFVLAGKGYINGRVVEKNTVFIFYENNRMNYFPCPEDPWKYIYVRVRGSEIKKAFAEHGFSQELTLLPFDDEVSLTHLLSLHKNFGGNDSFESKKMIANLLFLLFEKNNQQKASQSKQQQHAENVKEFIDSNFYKRITIEAIAAKLYLNKNYVRTVFVNNYGISPKQYLQQLRMKRAEFLLIHTNEDISLISRSVGYDDPLLFSKMFKRYCDLSPLKFRDEGKKAFRNED